MATPRLQPSEYEWPITLAFTPGMWPVYPGSGPSLAILRFEKSVGSAIANKSSSSSKSRQLVVAGLEEFAL